MENDFIYDIETMRNLFSCGIVHAATKTRWIFEVSPRRNQSRQFVEFIFWFKSIGARMVGFNNEAFDWTVIDRLVKLFRANGYFTEEDAYQIGQEIINAQRFTTTIWESDRIVKQVDLFKIHHFDNPSKSTSLKKLEIAMRAHDVIDLPYSPHEPLSPVQMDNVIEYMCHDVNETLRFYWLSADQIKFRDDLKAKYPDLGDVVNFNDTKVGKKYFERELEQRLPGSCYTRVKGQRKITNQTVRQQIAIAEVISPKVMLTHPEFVRVLNWLKQQILTRPQIADALAEKVETKGVFNGLVACVDGFDFVFGAGGIHGSLERQSVTADDNFDIIDIDVASYYPNLAITNGFYPAHLSADFCKVYKDLFDLRQTYGKKTAENAMLKLALNGVYGDSNNDFSPFRDAQYTMAITINGQLMICMLAENLLYYGGQRLDGVTIIQANTDGITLRVRKDMRPYVEGVCKAWEIHTGLTLESVDYSAMHIRDVNNYIAVKKKDGSVKRIGTYAYESALENPFTRELVWHKDQSMRVVAMAAEAQLVRGIPVEQFIMGHRDPFDFMLSIKVPRTSRLMHGDVQTQNVCRYYVSTDGYQMTKIMPPDRHFEVQKGWTVTLANSTDNFRWENVNWLFYIMEARKLLI